MSLIGLGGLARRRPDQQYRPGAQGVTPGARTNILAKLIRVIAGPGFQGVFLYSPAFAPADLIASVAASNGVDPKGNNYFQGEWVYSRTGAQTGIAAGLAAGAVRFADLASAVAAFPGLYTLLAAASGAELNVTSGKGTGPAQAVTITLLDSLLGNGGNPQAVVGAQNNPLVPATDALFEFQGLIGITSHGAPGTPPAGAGYLYVSSVDGSLHYKGHSGTDTMIAPG